MKHAFTVDVEDWYQGLPIPLESKAVAERRLRRGMDVLMELLDGAHSKGTFFFLGPVAQDYPELLRALARQGHEIGCHGWSHDLLYQMDRKRFAEETRNAKHLIEDTAGVNVKSYRAAYFSITRQSFWALEELVKLGFDCDSSIFPIETWRYGIADFDPKPQRLQTPEGPIFEIPMPVISRFGRNIPVSGGAYFRIFPYALTADNFRKSEQAGRPVVFYLHPWELDASHPRIKFYWKARASHYFNLKATGPRLKRLLNDFSFGTLKEVINDQFNGTSEKVLQ